MMMSIERIQVWPRPNDAKPAPQLTHCPCGATLLIVNGWLICEQRCPAMKLIGASRSYERDNPHLVVKSQPIAVYAKAIKEDRLIQLQLTRQQPQRG
jgi:hypothetical protein